MEATRAVERRIVSVLFADLVGFTALSERLDAEDVAFVQDAYFAVVRETIERHGGLLEKFVGDAAMAVFGAPRVRDDDAHRAVRAALALVAAVERLGVPLGLDEGALRLRVGVNSGEAVYGEATGERGPVTGDTVNVAARLQAAAEPGAVVVGEITALAVADAVELEQLEPLELKGKAARVPAYAVRGVFPERSRERALGALRAPMLGRERELSQLIAAIDGTARFVLVVAPPGVGKTRLVDELAAAASTSGAAVLRARLRPDLLAPFEPVAQLVRSAEPEDVAPRLAAAGFHSARAEVVADALGALLEPASSQGTAEPGERERLFAAWLEGLEALVRARPAVWLVEDVHWASADLLAFLDAAARAPTAAGRLVVATARPILLESAEAWCARREALDLRPLPPRETGELVRGLVGDALGEEVVERISERSGGNALFVEELLRMWVSAEVLVPAANGWALALAAADIPLPPTVQAIYAGQLDDLPAHARTAARRAAVAGRRFSLAAFEPLAIGDGDDAVAVLARRAFVAGPLADAVLGASYAFRHALLRDAGYASLARRERASLHLRLADWLAAREEASLPTLAEAIARHYAAALDAAPSLARDVEGRARAAISAAAAAWFERASAVAAGFAAWESAYALASRAVELTPVDDRVASARRLELRGAAAADAVGVAEAEPILREALERYRLAREQEPEAARTGLASAAASLGHLLRAQTRFQEAAELAAAVLAEIGEPDDLAVARLLLLRGRSVLNASDDYERGHADATRALGLSRAGADAVLELEALELLAQVQAERGEPDEDAWLTIERLARATGRWETAAGAIRVRASFHVDDEPQAALAIAAGAAELAQARGLVESIGWCDYQRAEATFALGDWDEAVASGLRAVELGEAHDFHRVVVRSWFVLLPIASARGRSDLLQQAAARFEARRGREPDSPYARVIATAAHLHLAAAGLEPLEVPDVESRLPSFELDHGGPSWLAAVMTLAETWLAAGDDNGVERALDAMRARLERANPSRLAMATETLLRGRLALGRGDRPGAAGEAERTLALTRAPWWRLRALHVLEAAGAPSPEHAAEAAELVHRLGIAEA